MKRQVKERLNRMIMRWMCAAVLTGLVVSSAWGQASTPTNEAGATAPEVLLPGARFDVATIKPSDPNAMGSSSGAWPDVSKNYPLKNAICGAYGVLISRCLGGSAWLESDRYDIEAKPDEATANQFLKLSWKQREAVQRRMEQALFANRIKLKAHFETREVTIFALVVAKGGLKMHEAKSSDGYANGLKRDDGKAYGAGVFSMSNSMGNATVTAQGTSLENLVLNLPGITGHAVEDRTGLTGFYSFTLHYSRLDPPPPDSNEPTIYTALEEQLGLKLESVKGPGRVLVIDSMERPSEN